MIAVHFSLDLRVNLVHFVLMILRLKLVVPCTVIVETGVLYPFGPSEGDRVLPSGDDDVFSEAIPIGVDCFPFGRLTHRFLYVRTIICMYV